MTSLIMIKEKSIIAAEREPDWIFFLISVQYVYTAELP